MIGFLNSPWADEFYDLVKGAETTLTLCSPFVGEEPCLGIISALRQTTQRPPPRILITTNLCRENLLSGATSAEGLLQIVKQFPQTTVIFLPSLHAKVYVADDRRAIVTSGNMTRGGLYHNVEYGVDFRNDVEVSKIRSDVLAFASLGTRMSEGSLGTLARIASELREIARKLERTTRKSLREQFEDKLADADLDVLRIRAGGRTSHAIFADAILYLLDKQPLRTAELNEAIRSIHPDLCDDNVDRIIDGRHYGKKWKHGVRTAQVYLRRQGKIERRDQHWHLVR